MRYFDKKGEWHDAELVVNNECVYVYSDKKDVPLELFKFFSKEVDLSDRHNVLVNDVEYTIIAEAVFASYFEFLNDPGVEA
jgi:hypothetical protein